ncbi:DUF2058 family protein [Dokdonella sp.]|uniref:DUF2058 family protein n=1 Tax=Dokdonella sp. TaxID=2291710 RepID=UPI002F3FACEC
MSDSLRDQLLKAGFAPLPKADNRPKPQQRSGQGRPQGQANARPQGKPSGKPGRAHAGRPPSPPREKGEIDLAKAYALRDRTEREQREREQREAEQRAREKRERKQKLTALLQVQGAALNDGGADIPRHFPHTNKIRRIYVTAEQLPRLNGGELAVVQLAGRYLLVTRETGLAAQAIDPDALVLLCDPQAPAPEDDIPADLVW